MSAPLFTQIAYLVSAVLFIVGLKRMSSPATARRGNVMAAVGMLLAIAGALLERGILTYTWILIGLAIGAAAGAVMAYTVRMTAMPQMVAVFNGFGGAASCLVAVSEFLESAGLGAAPAAGAAAPAATASLASAGGPIGPAVGAALASTGGPIPQAGTALATQAAAATAGATPDHLISIMAGTLIGAVTFSGSMIAYGKLEGLVSGRAVTYPLQKTFNLLLLLGLLAAAVWLVVVGLEDAAVPGDAAIPVFLAVVAASLLLGVLVVIPIGGADMPVVISLLNSYSGLAAAAAGFVLRNNGLIISGALVGASGLILTSIMCRAMNRSLANVLFGAFGGGPAGARAGASGTADRTATAIEAEDAAMSLGYARSVIIVPGYGLAVAQAQHRVRELADLLARRGVQVRYAIHPVAGRMPGHMNVLLAEANVPYTQLYALEDINASFPDTDVSLVVGANDVVNPAARDEPGSPIYGMPILEVDRSGHVVVMKRSLSPGFAGIDNDLFYRPNTRMFFGDAADSLAELIEEVKAL